MCTMLHYKFLPLPPNLQIRTTHQQFANRGSEEEWCYQVDMDVNNASLSFFFLPDIGYANVLL